MNSLPLTTTKGRKSLLPSLWVQVIIAIVVGIIIGRFDPRGGIALKPLGDGFIRLITMVITLIIFCTVVTGIAGMRDIKKVGRVGAKALLYFEVISTLALILGLIAGNLAHPGSGFNVNVKTLDASSIVGYADQTKTLSAVDFLMNIIPTTVVGAFANGNILQVVLIASLFGVAIAAMGQRAEPLVRVIDAAMHSIFGAVNMIMTLAPIGALGAMAFTVGKYGLISLGPLFRLILTFYLCCSVFVLVILGAVAWLSRFNILRFLLYIKEEIVLVLGTSSSEAAFPGLLRKLEAMGCSKAVVGLVVPTGYIFNTDGSSLYITMAALFVAQATNTHLTIYQQLTLFAVGTLTSKGASGVQGAGFIALAGTLMVVPTIPVAGMALLLGVDRFLSTFRALVNMIGNGVASVVIASSEKELDKVAMKRALRRHNDEWLPQELDH